MFRHVLFFACAVSLLQIVIGHSFDYRCGANGCLNGAVCQSNGQCSCSGTQFGTYCDTSATCVGATCTAANTITNGDQCYVGAVAKCICKDGFTGDGCASEILDVDCTSHPELTITINPHRYSDLSPFNGEIYFAEDKAKFDNLALITHADCKKTGAGPHAIDTATAKANCGNPGTSGTASIYYAYIKHNANIKSVEDQILEIACDSSSSTSASITNTIVDSSKEVQKTTINTVDDVTMKIRRDGGDTLTDFQVHDTVKVNDNIALTLESPTGFVIKSCEVNDGETTSPATIKVIEDWCVANEGLLLYSSKIVALEGAASNHGDHGLTTNTDAVKLPLKAVKFTSGSKMMFTCKLCMNKNCRDTTSSPTYTTCDKNLHIGDDLDTFQGRASLPATRRRRSVTNGTIGTTISVSLTVDEYKELLQEANESKETECFKSAVVLLPLILLASLLVIAMGMTFFFCNKFTQNMTEGQSNIGFKA